MSNYQARRRAIMAERAALRCEQLVDEMREQCRRRERQIWDECRERFDWEHQAMKAQMDAVIQSSIDLQRSAASVLYVGRGP